MKTHRIREIFASVVVDGKMLFTCTCGEWAEHFDDLVDGLAAHAEHVAKMRAGEVRAKVLN